MMVMTMAGCNLLCYLEVITVTAVVLLTSASYAQTLDCLVKGNSTCANRQYYYSQFSDCSCDDEDYISSGSGSGSGNGSGNGSDFGDCSPCNALCDTCYGPGASMCYSCQYMYIVREMGVATGTLTCEDGLIRDTSLHRLQCVDQCPDNLVRIGDECVDQCPDNLVRIEDECVDQCPDNLVRIGDECVDQCPDNLVRIGDECVDQCPDNFEIMNGECVCPVDDRRYYLNGSRCEECDEGSSVVNGRCVPHGDPKLSLSTGGIVGVLVGVAIAILLVALCITLCVCWCGYKAHQEKRFWARIRKEEENDDAIEGGAKLSNTFQKVRHSITRHTRHDARYGATPTTQQQNMSLPRKNVDSKAELTQYTAHETDFSHTSIPPVIVNPQVLEGEGQNARDSTYVKMTPASSWEALHQANNADGMVRSANYSPRPKPTSPNSHGRSFTYGETPTQEEYVELSPTHAQEAYTNPGITTPQQYETFRPITENADTPHTPDPEEEDQEMYVDLTPGPTVMPRGVRAAPQPQNTRTSTLDNQYITMRDRRTPSNSPTHGYINVPNSQEESLYQNVDTGQEMYANVR